MPSIFSHSIFGLVISRLKVQTTKKNLFYFCIILCTIVPDFDVISFYFKIPYSAPFGHRGFSHSILFAIFFSISISILFEKNILSKNFLIYVLIFFSATISHGIFDAMTNGGLGVCFFCPFESKRYFFEFRPIQVSPIGKNFFSKKGLEVILSELIWIWIPSFLFIALVEIFKYKKKNY